MTSKSNKAKHSNKSNLSDIYVRFIDILFAVVLGQSFVLINSEDGFKPWFVDPWSNAFGIATLLLVYGLVITSWIGYHQSTRKYHLKNPLRFIIDVFLLFLYYVGFVNANNFEVINWVFVGAFLSYTLWDALRIVEYYKQESWTRELLIRLIVSAVFTFVFLVTACSYIYILKEKVTGVKWGFFVFILFLLILYRYLKRYKESVS